MSNQIPEKEWISVSDRLPENEDDVLAFAEYDQFPITAWFRAGRWHVGTQVRDYLESSACLDSVLHKYKVTHWQPLPAPPH